MSTTRVRRRAFGEKNGRPSQAVRRFRRDMNPTRPAPMATRAAVVGSGTILMKPVAALNVAVCPNDKPLEITEASFGCIRDLKAVRGYYVGNLLGDIDATLA
jgi:hypothetical protein